MNTIVILKQSIKLFGNPNGHYDCKFNRIVKLAGNYNNLLTKFDTFINKCSLTDRSRHALACKLLMFTGIRIGNEDSAEGYIAKNKQREGEFVQTFGLTTLKKEHIIIEKNVVYLNFLGKRQVGQSIKITDKVLVKQITTVYNSNNDTELFLNITDYSLRRFIKKYVGKNFKAKDFRTLRANIDGYLFVEELKKRTLNTRKSQVNAEVKELTVHVSNILGNTPGITKKSYIDDQLINYTINERMK